MNNMSNLIGLLKSGGNPQVILLNMVQKQSQGNPMMQNVLNMMQNGNYSGVEQIARNLCNEKGINPDEMMKQIKNQF